MNHTATVIPPPSAVTMGRRNRVALCLLVSAQFLVMLDASIVNVALPSIQRELAFGPAAVTWVVNAYVLAFAGLLLLSGRAADLIGRRRIFVSGAAVFTAGTLLAAALSQEMLILGRVVQGVDAAGLSPAAMSLLLATFPAAQRARAMGAWGAASTVGGATGVGAGGVLAGSVGWRAVFLVTVPVSVAALALGRRVLAEDVAGVRRPFDWAGAPAVSGAVITLVHAAVDVVDHALISPRVGGLFISSVVLMTAFVVIERRAADPLLPLELFTSSGLLSRGTIVALLGGASRASTFVLVALYFQQVLALSPGQAGVAMVPTSLAGFAVSLTVLPRLLGTIGPVRSLVLGLVVLAAGHLWLAYVPVESGYVIAVLPALLLVATGVALSFTPTTMVLASAVPAAHTGLASGLAGASMQIGGALGTAGFIVVGIAAGGPVRSALDSSGFSAAFTAAAAVSLLTAALGATLPRHRS